MSLLLRYNLENGTPTIGEDSSGNSATLANTGVVSSVDPLGNFGNVAYFDGLSYLNLSSTSVPSELVGTSPRTISVWIYPENTSNATICANGTSATNSKIRFLWVGSSRVVNIDSANVGNAGSIPIPVSSWAHFVFTFDSSSTMKTYINGVNDINVSTPGINTGSGDLSLGRDPINSNLNEFEGYMLDYRAYDTALDLADITTIYNDGPRDLYKVNLEATMYTHLADIVWSSISNASTYTLTQTVPGGEITILDNSTELLFTTTALVPNTSYQFNLYTNLDLVTPAFTITETTPVIDATSSSELSTRMGNDFTDLGNFNPEEIQAFLKDMFSTQDIVTMSSGKYVFVEDTDSINFVLNSDVEGILTPFEPSDGSGQNFTLDSSTVNYNETLNEVTIGSNTLSTGGSSVFNGYKVTMKNI